MRDLWYKDAIIYCLDVETFMDADGDGIGDFEGLASRLDYIAGLGVNCIWLLPFFPSPNRDNGYDVMDYYGVDRRLGTLGNFVEFIRGARERGLRVIMDLVVNHTSDQHTWFQEARSDKDSKYRDFYVWSDNRPEDADEGVVFPGVQEEVWTYDRKAKAYYFHRFYKHQPDLNIANPDVREEIERIMGFWLELGVSGFRVDAAPFLIELKGIEVPGTASPYKYLREFRDFLSWRRGDAILLAEANVAMEKVPEYFGDGTKLQMLFNFMLNQHLFLALARHAKAPLVEGMHLPPAIPDSGQWVNFLRNHDELDLGRLTEAQRGTVFEAFAPKKSMRLYDRGIRRRLPPMLGGDERRLRMAYSLMFTLPGTPVLRYGEEIGMGDDLSLSERNAVRTAMQWDAKKNGGFSTAAPNDLARPAIHKGEYGYEKVNVDEQRRDPDSLLSWMERIIRTRKDCPEIGWGTWDIVETDRPDVFAHACQYQGGTVVALHNLGDQGVEGTLDLSAFDASKAIDLLGGRRETALDSGVHAFALDPYGFRWFRLEGR